jgi:hypothetical protein
MKYKLEDINIGDEVYFDSTTSQLNYDLYWKVINKLEKEKKLLVQLDEMGFHNKRWIISIDEVRLHIGQNKK